MSDDSPLFWFAIRNVRANFAYALDAHPGRASTDCLAVPDKLLARRAMATKNKSLA